MTGAGAGAGASAGARHRALVVWIIIAVVLWNGLYDLRISLGVRDYLLDAALHEAGRGPWLDLSETMRHTVREAVKVASFWTSIILIAALWTIRMARSATEHVARGT